MKMDAQYLDPLLRRVRCQGLMRDSCDGDRKWSYFTLNSYFLQHTVRIPLISLSDTVRHLLKYGGSDKYVSQPTPEEIEAALDNL